MEYVNATRLKEGLSRAQATYESADPFPHLVLDGILKDDVAQALEAQFPPPDDRIWKHHLHLNAHKFACNRLDAMSPLFRGVLRELNSQPVIDLLEQLTGITHLVSDAGLEGGGLHQIVRGGYLKIHADFNYHPITQHHRRLNLLVYLNSGWQDSWDGNLDLWDRQMSRCVRSVTPVLNRCVLFSTTDFAYHGHPRPLSCPDGASRKSLAVYYYTVERPAEEISRSHSTLYQRAPTDSRLAQSLAFARRVLTPGAFPQFLKASLRRLRR